MPPALISVILGCCVSVTKPDLPPLMSWAAFWERNQDAPGMTSARNLPFSGHFKDGEIESQKRRDLPKAIEQFSSQART